MRKYDIKCDQGHYSEIEQQVSEFKSDHVCLCGMPAKVVITRPPMFNMDWEDRQGLNESAGRFFSNRGEKREWMARNDAYEIGPEDNARMHQERKETVEAQADLGKAAFIQHVAAGRRRRIVARDAVHRQSYAPAVEAATHDLVAGGISAGDLIGSMPIADRAPVVSDVQSVSKDGTLVMAS